MHSFAFKLSVGIVVALSTLWLAGYAQALRPFIADAFRDHDFDFLTYPNIKIYRVFVPATGKLSPRQIDFFSVCDGPTGEVVAESYFPCWVISIAALGGLIGGAGTLFLTRRKKAD
jgi:hypothetical protein